MTNKKVASDIRPMSERVTARPPSGLRKAKQAFKDEVDINSIVSRFIKSGVPIPAPQSRPTFLDMASLPANLQDALQLRARLDSVISTFPPALRAAYLSHPNELMKALDARLADLKQEGAKKAPPKPDDAPKSDEKGSPITPPPVKA